MSGAAWRVTIDQISGSGGRARFEYVSASSSTIELAISGALAEARLTEVVHGQYQITVVPSVASSVQRQLGVCPACGLNRGVRNIEADLFTCVEMGCGARWRGARLGTPT